MVSGSSNQYAPPKSTVADVGENEPFAKATRGSRLGAVMLDGLIGFAWFVPAYIENFQSIVQQSRGNPFGAWVAIAKSGGWFYVGLLGSLLVLAVDLVLLSRNGQTIGKKILGIKVVRTDGSAVSLARVFLLRYVFNTFLSLIPLLGSIYSLTDSLFIFGAPRRTIHDYIADTIVINA